MTVFQALSNTTQGMSKGSGRGEYSISVRILQHNSMNTGNSKSSGYMPFSIIPPALVLGAIDTSEMVGDRIRRAFGAGKNDLEALPLLGMVAGHGCSGVTTI